MDRQTLAMLIPIVAIVMGIGIAMLGLVLDYRRKRDIFELLHKERMAAIEKGMEVPALPVELLQGGRRSRTPSCYLRRGVMLLLVGVAVTIALYVRNRDASVWGLVPSAVGIAYLLFYWLDVRKPAQLDRQ
jgi:hypothetical protein